MRTSHAKPLRRVARGGDPRGGDGGGDGDGSGSGSGGVTGVAGGEGSASGPGMRACGTIRGVSLHYQTCGDAAAVVRNATDCNRKLKDASYRVVHLDSSTYGERGKPHD
jgi:hypothetical protein